ncbi:MAG: NACHT domain-containing protein, partial [Chloroflexota bacterium]
WLTPLIGRDSEIAWVQAQLDNPHCRLLTLTGPGGIGKTHLALEAIKTRLNRFPDGVFLISLAALPLPQDILPVLAQVLNLPAPDNVDLRRHLFTHLRPKKLLLVLDSFEVLLAAPGLASQTGSMVISSLLEEAPWLKIVVTSRMRLNLHGEHVLALDGLRYPPVQAGDAVDPEDYSAMALFLNSAGRLHPRYVPTAGDLADIAHICRQVEGLPLAIILAASWMELLAPREIAAEIDRDIDFLIIKAGNIPQRHRNLRAVFNHSWRLLSDGEQAIFQSLSVFRGGFTRIAAQAVAGASAQELRTLVSRSLLQRSPKDRYMLHPLLRYYAAEKLAAEPEILARVCRQHSTFYAASSHDWVKMLRGKHQQAAIAEMRQEINNLQVAWDWAVTNREHSSVAQALDGLCTYYHYHNHYQKGLATCQAATKAIAKDQSPEGLRLTARLLSWQSVFSAHLGHMEQAIFLSQRCLDIFKDLVLAGEDVRPEKAFALLQLARQLTESDLKQAGQLAEESANLHRELADEWGTAEALETLGQVAWLTADYQSTYQYLQECLGLRRSLLDSRGLAAVLGTLGFVCFQMGDFDQAEAFIREGINLKQKLGDLAGAADSLFNLAMAMLWLGEFEEVNNLLTPAINTFEKKGAATEAVRLQALRAMAQALLGRYAEASDIAKASLSFARSNGLERETGILLWVLGFLTVATGDYVKAERQLVEGSQLLKSLGLWDILAAAQVALGYVALSLNDLGQARQCFLEALQHQPGPQSKGLTLLALPGIALLLARSGHLARSVEVDSLATQFPFITNSRFFEDIAKRPLEQLIAVLPAETIAQARARGQSATLERAIPPLLAELGNLDGQLQAIPS